MNKLNLRKFYFFLVLMSFIGGPVLSQGYNTSNWKFSNPKQFGFNLTDVDYFDNNNVIAVGSDGGIAKSTDGGRNWTYGCFTYLNLAGLKAKGNFTDVHFITSTTAYAVGTGGLMIKTTDAGATWNTVTTPLWANAKSINTCFFLDANKGYIGGQMNNTPDSLPKIYFTLNGGTTWDSIAAPPSNGVSRGGYINNVNVPSALVPVDSKIKEIQRIEFLNNNLAYIIGSASTTSPRVSSTSTASPACAANPAGNLTTSAHAAALLWKFNNGVLTDYSISKERIGYFGINTNTVTCTTTYGSVTPAQQTYKAINIIDDSTIVMMSFNNNIVLKVHTGVNDSTLNVNAAGVYEKGKYEILNWQGTPTQGPNAGPSIPPVQVLLASNPLRINRAASGKLIAGSTNSTFAGTPGYLWTSVDTGRTWRQEVPYPQTPNIIANAVGAQVVDIAPNGRVLVMGSFGAVTDSLPGGSWQSNWLSVPVSAGYNDIEFVDCNNGIAAGSASITVTTDGGNTWIDRFSPVLQALNAQIGSVSYVSLTKVYFPTSIGNIYRSANQAQNLSPVFGEPTARLNDMATIGQDSLWACGDLFNSPLPTAQRSGVVYRSFNNAATWDTVRVGPIGSATFITWRGIEFPTRTVGYVVGNRNSIYKTIDAGATWTDISPTPVIIATMSYTDVQALNKDTVFVTGNGFPNKVVYRTIDGGATWVNITGNIAATGAGNLNGILMHDANNGYVMSPGAILVTNNGGATWTYDPAPSSCIFTPAAFVPKTVGPGVSMINRKMFVSGVNVSGAPMMEYGNPANTQVNSTEVTTDVTCTSPNTGSIVINATGGLAPYTYSINGGPYVATNTFSGLTQGTYTISIKDAYCGLLTKTVTIALTNNLTVTTNISNTTICQGGSVQLIATSQATTFAWTPALGLSNPNIFNPIATPAATTTYTVTASLNGCLKTADVVINVNPNPTLSIVADPGTTLCAGDPTRLTVVSIPPGPLTGYSFVWSPAAGLSSTTTNPVAASPAVTTTYTVIGTTGSGCIGQASITITVNDRPAVTAQPVSTSVCAGSVVTFSAAGSGTGVSYQWQESTNGGVTYNNLTNIAPYSGVTTTTLTINAATVAMNNNRYRLVVSGTCPPAATSNGAVLTVVGLPTIAINPASSICGGIAGINGTALTASGASSYIWSPTAGLYTNSGATTAYTSTNLATVYAAPTVNTVYTVTGTSAATGCSSTAAITVNYTPTAPTVSPASAAICLGSIQSLAITSSLAPSTVTVASGPITVVVPDGTGAAAISNITIAGIPSIASVSEIKVTFNMSHTWVGDMDINLKAPNGSILNLVGGLDGGNGSNGTDDFTNTSFSSLGGTVISGAAAPRTGTYAAEVRAGYGPAGYIQNATTWGALVPNANAANGTWTLAMGDWGGGDVGTLTSWSVSVSYGLPSTGLWSRNSAGSGDYTGLYLDNLATTQYAGTSVQTVYAKPNAAGTYNYYVTVSTGTCTSAGKLVPVTVNQAAAITTNPVNAKTCTDNSTSFSVAASGTGTLGYQWQVSTDNGTTYTNVSNGGVYNGVTSATLIVSQPPVSMNGYYYRCVVQGAAPCVAATSGFAILTVSPLPVVVISASPYRNLMPGMVTTLSSTVSPNPATSYNWFRDGVLVAGAGTGTLSVNTDKLGDYTLKVTDINGCTSTSNTVSIRDSVSGILFIYPNPNNGLFQVRFHSAYYNVLPRGLIIYDAKGDQVLVKEYTITAPYSRMDVDLRKFGKGIYWVELVDRNSKRLAVGRVVVQ